MSPEYTEGDETDPVDAETEKNTAFQSERSSDGQLDARDQGHSRASLSLSRRGALASLLGFSGFSLLSGQVSAADGDHQGQNSASVSANSQYTHTVTFPNPEPDSLTSLSRGDLFGRAVSLSADGQTALVGAPFDDTETVQEAGEAYIFTQTTEGWDITDPITLPNPEPDTEAENDWLEDHFGQAVALSADGQTALIGAPADDSVTEGSFEQNRGEAYIFERAATGWDITNPTTIPHPAHPLPDFSRFGESVALNADGTTALIGAPGEYVDDGLYGVAHVFRRTDAGWDTTNPVELRQPILGPYYLDSFSQSVALSNDGTTALVGGTGVAALFSQTEAGWNSDDPVVLPNPDFPNFDNAFGWDVALSADGSIALIGAPYLNETYLFRQTTAGWDTANPVVLLNPEPDTGDEFSTEDLFGWTVALSADGNTALVSAPYDDTDVGEDVGEVYVFRRTNEGWKTTDPLTLSNPEADSIDLFGFDASLSADGNSALIGAPGDNTTVGDWVGEAYLFERGGQPLVFDDQTTSGDTVRVSSVAMPEGGFVVIASADGDTIYGVSEYLTPGLTTDLQIALEAPLPESGTYLASGQADTNANRRYDAPRVLDICQLDANEIALLDTAKITVQK